MQMKARHVKMIKSRMLRGRRRNGEERGLKRKT